MFKRAVSVLLSAAVCLLLSGCNVVGSSVESLVHPPQLSEQQAQVYQALEASVRQKDSVTLQSPQNGSYRSAVILHNIDQEPGDEAIVFYKSNIQNTLGENALRVCLLDQIDGRWWAVWDVPGGGAKVDKVLFLRENVTGMLYLILGFQPEDTGQNAYFVYSYENRQFIRVSNGFYQMMEVYDITSDGQEELVTVGYDEDLEQQGLSLDTGTPTAAIHSVKNGTFSSWGSTPMCTTAMAYNNIHKDNSSFGGPSLVLDEMLTNTTYATEILTFDGTRLRNLMLDAGEQVFEQTRRTQLPISYDIDRDGVVEIPQTEFFPGYSSDSTNPAYLSVWRKLENGKWVDAAAAYTNYNQGFAFILPESWRGRVTAKNLVQNDEVEFFVYQGNLSDDHQPLLSLRTNTVADKDNVPYGYFTIATVGQMVYLAKISDSRTGLELSEQEVRERFVEMYITSG